ncbi:MAG TPA: phytanoyl-CoA dioxygenase family protein, partial [Tepidisphaeraceae bacterium]|nr:phytanoyl-CoA dioxygenase family protein [Tepidisphaeraceae bacterium]
MMPTNLKDSFSRDGYLINRTDLLPEGVVRRASEGMDAIRRGEYDTGRGPEGSPWKPGDSPNVLCKIEQPQLASKAVLELISHPTIGKWAAAAMGAKKVQVWWVQLLFKPPTPPNARFHTNVGWHQDRAYWGNWKPESELLTAWVALSDVSADSGPMEFVSRSNRWGLQSVSDFHGQDLEAIQSKVKIPPGQQWEQVAATIPPGGFTLH